MPDIVKLLPDHVANQISAGEVILRPASVVKELLENAVDAGAGSIKVLIKDAGKSLIQIIDDGCGMSELDVRMSFERHATSKIASADDLFSIHTMGFRGEALASIAAIAMVEVKTKRREDELGSELVIEGTVVKHQSPVSCPDGTSFSVKNLFFNVPARRNFLKSDTVETNHIMEEFYRVALVNQDITFSLFNNNREVLHLSPSNLKQRILQIFGNSLNEKLVPVEQETAVVSIKGFVGKPENAKKTRGEQYFFVNGRFIRQPFFHHAIDGAYRQLLPEGYFPAYFIYFSVDPAALDVNIHPTKTEVKFLDDKVIYSILHSTVKLGLGRSNLTPSIEFDVEQSFDLSTRPVDRPVTPPQIKINPDYNPFLNRMPDPLQSGRNRSNKENWEKLFDPFGEKNGDLSGSRQADDQSSFSETTKSDEDFLSANKDLFQLKNRYILAAVRSGIMVIDQQRAHERILFEKIMEQLENNIIFSQQELFPVNIKFSTIDASLLHELLPDIRMLGFTIEAARHNGDTFIVSGVPVDLEKSEVQTVLEEIIESFKKIGTGIEWNKNTRLAHSLAKNMAIKAGKPLRQQEMNKLSDELFSCKVPDLTPEGKAILTIISMDEIVNRLK